jgi:serine/threonine protein kinase/tetratricopeptide (TPR) repeat protein
MSIQPMIDEFEQMILPIGATIGKYCIVEEIDRGGMAAVYKAVQTDLDRFVALKIMPSNISLNAGFMERYMREAHAVAQLSHPNIVSIYEIAREDNIFFLAMEYVPGPNLFHFLYQSKPKLVEVLDIIGSLADALSYAHGRKIIHRDLKLNNVIMKNGNTPILIDFGLAKVMESDGQTGLTRTGELIGSPSYMAPERLSGGTVDFRSDICSLGIMLYEMLTFKNPYLDQRNLHQTAMNVMEATPLAPRKLVRWLPAEIEAITLKAMAKEPSDRYQSMAEFKADINRYQHGGLVEARPPTLSSRVSHFVRRYWSVLGIIATIAIFSALFAASLYIQNRKEMSHWQLLFSCRFADRAEGSAWRFFPGNDTGPLPATNGWEISGGVLACLPRTPGHAAAGGARNAGPGGAVSDGAGGTTYARFEGRINHEIRIEFDAGAAGRPDLYGAGLFLFGETPDSAFRFYLSRRGEGACGIAFPGNDFLFQTGDRRLAMPKVRLLASNHITIECIRETITFAINGEVVARVRDCMLPLGTLHEQLGFFTRDGGVWFNNLKIFRRAVPAMPSPTFVAERFRERGDFQTALEEYRTLLVDFGASEWAREIHLSIAECLVRLGRFDEALKALDAAPHTGDATYESRKLFIRGIARESLGHRGAADSDFIRLSTLYPNAEANDGAMALAALAVEREISASHLDHAEKSLLEFSTRYPRSADVGERLANSLMNAYLREEQPDSAIAVMDHWITALKGISEDRTDAEADLGRALMARGSTIQANDVFNRCITAPQLSLGVWEAWIGLAEIYEYAFKRQEAREVYRKVYHECPRTLSFPWIAALRLGELTAPDSVRQRNEYFRQVAAGSHPFALLRLSARYYLDAIADSALISEWETLRPGDCSYLFCFARKAHWSRNDTVAAGDLLRLKACVAPQSWDYIVASEALNNLRRW